MSTQDRWAGDPHVDVPTGRPCGARSRRTGNVCNLDTGHDGDHAFVWRHLPTLHGVLAGRVRETWE